MPAGWDGAPCLRHAAAGGDAAPPDDGAPDAAAERFRADPVHAGASDLKVRTIHGSGGGSVTVFASSSGEPVARGLPAIRIAVPSLHSLRVEASPAPSERRVSAAKTDPLRPSVVAVAELPTDGAAEFTHLLPGEYVVSRGERTQRVRVPETSVVRFR